MWNIPTTCPRCGGPMGCHSVSYFNTEDICCECKHDERHFPGNAAALAAEEAAVRSGNLNFTGVGLSELDRQLMRQLLAERRQATAHI
jgi:hypothetical protein